MPKAVRKVKGCQTREVAVDVVELQAPLPITTKFLVKFFKHTCQSSAYRLPRGTFSSKRPDHPHNLFH
jgi:hypothetical protein